ncbi:hypothetical protein ACFU8W_38785 [Streptomyces sp. NPDC057565]|uniref:hypothetical protein n=1 Tax=Streptomyces sp. NPDC057565 TaxID=3346169 RepID=UPI0036A48913
MTPRRAQRPDATQQPAPDGPVLYPGTTREAWCPDCRAWTGITAELLLLTSEGVATAGDLTWCEVCQDPTSPLPVRRIDRG